MKNKKIIPIITALCCMLTMSACDKKQDDTGNIPSSTTASKVEEKSGETTVIDVFSELNVTFEGENGSGKVVCEYTGDNDFIKYDVEFKGDRNGRYKNGDTAVVKLDYSDLRAENANVYFKEKEHEYTVDGLWGVILSPDGYDFTECNKVLEERMFDKERSDSKFNIKELDIGNTFFTTFIDGEIDSTCWKILSVEYEPIRGKFLIPEYSSKISNYYYLFYQATVKCEKIEGDFVINPNSKYAVGDTKEWNFVICEETHNVFVEKGSKIIKIDPQAHRVVSYEVGAAIDVMSIESIYGKDSEIEYNNNFDEFFDKEICRYLENGTFYDIEIQ
ncbi:MAG: hypothetical protein OSJ61_10130 [Lachnospiraceae bacterium]|nr:hypothetical protein [Lachnospiraceae bacterium]